MNVTLRARETAIISVDNIQTFQNESLKELYVSTGEKTAKESKRLLDRGTANKLIKINVREKHPCGHISFASSYKYKRSHETVDYQETKNREEKMLSKTA
jgi:nicotinamidase-related amidase